MVGDPREVIEYIVGTRMQEFAPTETGPDRSAAVLDVIEAIKTAYHLDWEKQKIRFAHEFLSRTWAGIPLPVLSVCGRGTQEIRYSTYLAYFLDGSRPHGLGTRYLDGLLSHLKQDGVDTYGSIVETEKWLGPAREGEKTADCFCDIVVTCKHSDCVIFLEQKINSGESPNPIMDLSQLQRYDSAIRRNTEFTSRQRQIRVFLTPQGKQSSNSPQWQPLSYTDLVYVGLDVLHKGGLSGTARENLRRFLMDLALGPFSKAESEIRDLVDLALKATTDTNFVDRLRFDQAHIKNRMLVDLLMEG